MDVVYYAAMSVDGFIAKPDGNVGWLDKYVQSGEDYGYSRFFQSVEAMLMGRGTYEKTLSFGDWCYGEKPCWVMSSTLTETNIAPVKLVNDDPQNVIDQIADFGFQKIWLVGGGQLGASLMRAGLLTTFELAVIPEFLGQGIPLIQPGDYGASLNLVDSKKFSNGVCLVKYRTTN